MKKEVLGLDKRRTVHPCSEEDCTPARKFPDATVLEMRMNPMINIVDQVVAPINGRLSEFEVPHQRERVTLARESQC